MSCLLDANSSVREEAERCLLVILEKGSAVGLSIGDHAGAIIDGLMSRAGSGGGSGGSSQSSDSNENISTKCIKLLLRVSLVVLWYGI
jgi:hypothetical protein